MNRVEHLLSNLAEECAEVGQRATKAQRFTLGEVQPGQEFTNAERIMHELYDIEAVVQVLFTEGLLAHTVDREARVDFKKNRMENLMRTRSKAFGALTE